MQTEADRCGMWYVNHRWLGGTLTNYQTIRTRIDYMIDLQQKREQGYFRLLPKKEGVKLEETLIKLEKYFLGIKNMTALPSAMFVVDIVKESICIAEAHRMGIPIFSILDSLSEICFSLVLIQSENLFSASSSLKAPFLTPTDKCFFIITPLYERIDLAVLVG